MLRMILVATWHILDLHRSILVLYRRDIERLFVPSATTITFVDSFVLVKGPSHFEILSLYPITTSPRNIEYFWRTVAFIVGIFELLLALP